MKVAVLGATGGSSLAAVKLLAVKPDVEITALVRSKEKLQKLYGSDLPANINVVEGDALNVDAVKKTISGQDIVVSGVGYLPKPPGLSTLWKGFEFEGNLHLCEQAAEVLVKAAEALPAGDRPKRVIALSTTGIDDHKRDVPYAFQWFYHWALSVPHDDKKAMEKVLTTQKVIPEFVIVRGALYTDGKQTGKYRAGEDVIGYTISRDDVGHFIATQAVLEDKWANKRVSVAY